MEKEGDNGTSVVRSETSHRCGRSCLGPLTFHPVAVGDMVTLSRGGRLAERTGTTFENGLVFGSRPVKVRERIRLRVEKDSIRWQGALRVGFTNVPPSDRALPLPNMAIPNLTDGHGHWAAPVGESHCPAGSELEFWLSGRGSVFVRSANFKKHRLLTGVDLSRPLWVMIDIYGQTCAVSLLGSEQRELFQTRRSCPAPKHLTSLDADKHNRLIPVSSLHGNGDDRISFGTKDPAGRGSVKDCVVCMDKQARVTLSCGHRCLCNQCASRVFRQFGTCPLCRFKIGAPSVDGI
ncbi:E3 ubiquitin-protein ligase NEURL3-like [Pseudoliparis swirei]|uniref:E3 ubiquitin-protein ligase NEURL3-like n=1 Tax=Pseudoliparis swirei TaxID=2059687 RepID=UPI0024BDA72C|nr:E3 ubiquitin-protein ligase NEURL3-like [Pseudoliparis swirei]